MALTASVPNRPVVRVPVAGFGAPEASAPMRLSVLGATGSIGKNTLDLVGRAPDRFEIVALTAQSNASELAVLARRHRARFAVIGDESQLAELCDALAGTGIPVAAGIDALIEAAMMPADCVMAAIVGAAGLRPTFAAASRGARIALANKECLVSAGHVFTAEIARSGAELLPVDSEHSAAFQALSGADPKSIEKIVLTASGGPFRTWTREALEAATPEQALKHPNWSMGAKVTIDSATLMNKGLELIEAFHLFPVPAEAARLRRPSAVDRALPRQLRRRLGACSDGAARHAHADCSGARVAEANGSADGKTRSGAARVFDVRGAR